MKSVKQLLEELSWPEGREVEMSHAREVWEDGEVTLTKSGSLYGCRNLHCVALPIISEAEGRKYLDSMDQISGVHGNICVRHESDAIQIREAMVRELQA